MAQIITGDHETITRRPCIDRLAVALRDNLQILPLHLKGVLLLPELDYPKTDRFRLRAVATVILRAWELDPPPLTAR